MREGKTMSENGVAASREFRVPAFTYVLVHNRWGERDGRLPACQQHGLTHDVLAFFRDVQCRHHPLVVCSYARLVLSAMRYKEWVTGGGGGGGEGGLFGAALITEYTR